MQINSETFKKLRKSKGFSQQTLADESGVAKKTIARLENGEGEPRGSTVQELAKALRVKPEVLAKEPESEAVREEELQKHGLRLVKLVLDGETILAYGLVAEQYGVETRQIIKAAPLLFTLLAEMGLNERRRRLEEAETAMAAFPAHLIPRSLLALDAERASIDQRDIFTRRIDEHELNESYYNEDVRNPFNDFLIEQAKSLGSENDAIDPEEIHNSGDFDDLPSFSIFESYRKNLTGGSARAAHALSHGYVRISQIPEELLRGEEQDVTTKRVKWLEDRVPNRDWAEYRDWIDSLNLSL